MSDVPSTIYSGQNGSSIELMQSEIDNGFTDSNQLFSGVDKRQANRALHAMESGYLGDVAAATKRLVFVACNYNEFGYTAKTPLILIGAMRRARSKLEDPMELSDEYKPLVDIANSYKEDDPDLANLYFEAAGVIPTEMIEPEPLFPTHIGYRIVDPGKL